MGGTLPPVGSACELTRPEQETNVHRVVATEPEVFDSIGRTLGLIGDRWTMLVLRDVFRGLRRFDEFRTDLGIARPVLSDRLRKLVEAGVLEKVPYQERPVRYEYRLTAMGVELSPALVALMRWGDRWLAGDHQTVVLFHAPCGTELEQAFWCRTCATTFGPLAIRSRAAEG
jgi:DNA-binding HxlR family transcriptional regulator